VDSLSSRDRAAARGITISKVALYNHDKDSAPCHTGLRLQLRRHLLWHVQLQNASNARMLHRQPASRNAIHESSEDTDKTDESDLVLTGRRRVV